MELFINFTKNFIIWFTNGVEHIIKNVYKSKGVRAHFSETLDFLF